MCRFLFGVSLIMMLQFVQRAEGTDVNNQGIGKGHIKHGNGKGLGHDPCEALRCLNDGTCSTNLVGTAICKCVVGFSGQYCETYDPCASLTCSNGGTCSTNLAGKASCTCVVGFSGQNCDTYDPCASLTCSNGGTCSTNLAGIASCKCVVGFSGQNCETYDPCASLTCSNGGTCSTNLAGIASCTCVVGFSGQNCDTYDPCAAITCSNGGTCFTNLVGIASCKCVVGFSGQNCDTYDPCAALTCSNGGTCSTNLAGIASCTCVVGFSGHNCDTDCGTNYTYFSEIDMWVKFYNDPKTKDEAQSRCAAENARLVILDTEAKDRFYRTFLIDHAGSVIDFWIGAIWLTGVNSLSIWQWLDGQMLQNTYQNWSPNEPRTNSNLHVFHCAAYHKFGDGSFAWWAGSCSWTLVSICEKHKMC